MSIGRGHAAKLFLDEAGIPARVPNIRSSDYELVLSNPFIYYLTRRLGLCSAFTPSTALARGSWFHAMFEHDDLSQPEPSITGIEALVGKRRQEIGDTCSELGIVGETRSKILTEIQRDADVARAWYDATHNLPLPSPFDSWRAYLRRDYWQLMGRELRVEIPQRKGPSLVAQFDALFYHKKHNTLWIVDFKTTSHDPKLRALTVTREFQTQHYLSILRKAIDTKAFDFTLPSNCEVGGMMHIIVQKCHLEFGMSDRNFSLEPFTPTRGPNKGVTRYEKNYHGDPVYSNYLGRVSRWYRCVDEYADLKPKRETSPAVNISLTTFTDVLDSEGQQEYDDRLELIESYALCQAYPSNFRLSTSSLISHSEPSPWAAFAFTPVQSWPDLLNHNQLRIQHRE